MSLVILCLHFSFVDYVPVKGEIIWYLSLTAWLISLSIMPSSSIQIVKRVGAPFSLLHRIPLYKCTMFWFCFSFSFIFKIFFLIFIHLHLSAFSPHPSTPTQPTPPPSLTTPSPLILSLCPGSSSGTLSQLSPPHSPLAIVTLFLISISLYILFAFFFY